MEKQPPASRSIVNQFTRHYLIISIIPIIFLLILILTGAVMTRNYLTDLITKSTYDLNHDAEHSLQHLGEEIIMAKSRDVARQIEMYFRMHPNKTFAEMRKDPLFMELALQKVGKTGYTVITEARKPGDKPTPGLGLEPVICRVHERSKLNDSDLSVIGKTMPAFWAICKRGLDGIETSGYYDWREPDGSFRKKYLFVTPVKVKRNGVIIMVSATTYIDEFSIPMLAMKSKADKVVDNYQLYVSQMLVIFGGVSAAVLFLTFLGTYFLGRRAGLRYIVPITRLAETAKYLGEGHWDVQLPDRVLEREDEIGVMAQSFSRMSQQFKETFSSLEQRVAELKQAQEALKKSGEHYRSLFDGIPVGLYRSAPDGTFLDANPMLVEMMGYPDKNTFMLCSAENLYIDPDDRAIWQSSLQEKGGVHLNEIRLRKYNGTEMLVEDHSRAVHDEHGNILYYEGSLKDTTERKLAEAALIKSEESFRNLYEESKRAQEVYRSLINSSADAIVIYDLEGNVGYCSPMFTNVFGWSAQELNGRKIPFLPESERETTMAIIKEIVENGTPCQGFETKRTTKDGRILDISISASRYNDHQNNPAGMLVILRDISEAKRLEAHLQQVERLEAIGTLAGGIAHDFNNLLTVIQGTVSILLYSTQSSHPHYQHFINMEKQAQRGSKLTKQLLGYARKGKYEVKPININGIIIETAETLQQTRKDIHIHYNLASDLDSIEADIYQMEQALMNLYINAADAMNNGGDLTLTTRNVLSDEILNTIYEVKTGKYILITVEDTGIGMDKKTLDRVFEPFFTTKGMDKGTGLGLASVYGIIKGHGGHINVTSELGCRTIFNVYLPASEKPITTFPAEPKKALTGQGAVLIVDDEKPVLEVGAEMLKAIGYKVFKAQNGSTAIDLYKEYQDQIDLVILDMILPDLGGGQIFDLLKEINPAVAVILSSGYSIEGKATDILNRGCKGFIQKPFSMEELAEKIKSVINK
jgi:two-component system cell cycle sensor histidine kinase/response regulator CckA